MAFFVLGATGGEVVGAVIGVEVGGMLGIGSLCCGLLGGAVTKSLMEEVTWSIFDTTQTDAKVNAYDYMGVNKNASDEEINRAYHKKLRQCHPDKGGSEEQFLQLQMHLQVIRMARGHDLWHDLWFRIEMVVPELFLYNLVSMDKVKFAPVEYSLLISMIH